ncbi:hypothetical protein, partial [Bartonella sp. AC53GZZY]|uniref:hypothetical protein n=1 Tax=Bartonella sp. AC53GZZY TaxID=3243456 RepID=UPI0035CEE366
MELHSPAAAAAEGGSEQNVPPPRWGREGVAKRRATPLVAPLSKRECGGEGVRVVGMNQNLPKLAPGQRFLEAYIRGVCPSK